MSVRMIVSTVVDSVSSVEGISLVTASTVPGVGGSGALVVWISPARTTPVSTVARANARAKRLILSVSPLRLRNASLLARKHDSVNTYNTIDTASCAVTNIWRWHVRLLSTHRQRFIFREDGLT